MDERLKAEFDYIVDVITCADGGVMFFKFRMLLENLSKRAQTGDTEAAYVLTQVHIFKRLIEAAQKEGPKIEL